MGKRAKGQAKEEEKREKRKRRSRRADVRKEVCIFFAHVCV